MGLLDMIHSDRRGPQLWHLNKEGLFSLPGYWALSLISVGLSSHLHCNGYKPKQDQAATGLGSRYTTKCHLHVKSNAVDADAVKYSCMNT